MSSTSFETWLCARHHGRCYMSDSRVQLSKQQVHKKSCMLWGGHNSNTPGVQRTGGKFTFKWESREVFLGKAMMKLDLKGGCNLDIGSRRWKKPFVWVSLQDPLEGLQDPGFPKASCWLSSETLPATYLPAPILTFLLSQVGAVMKIDGQGHIHAVSGSWLHYLLSGSSHESWGSSPILTSSTFLFYTASSPSTGWITLECQRCCHSDWRPIAHIPCLQTNAIFHLCSLA